MSDDSTYCLVYCSEGLLVVPIHPRDVVDHLAVLGLVLTAQSISLMVKIVLFKDDLRISELRERDPNNDDTSCFTVFEIKSFAEPSPADTYQDCACSFFSCHSNILFEFLDHGFVTIRFLLFNVKWFNFYHFICEFVADPELKSIIHHAVGWEKDKDSTFHKACAIHYRIAKIHHHCCIVSCSVLEVEFLPTRVLSNDLDADLILVNDVLV